MTRISILSLHKKHFLIGCILLLLSNMTTAQVWTQKNNFSGPARDAGICFQINNKIYLGCGVDHHDFWQYDPATDQWTQKANVPNTINERISAVGFAINGKGYVGLGLDTGCTADLWEYNPGTDQWARKSDFPGGPREGAFCFVINNKAYIGGGADSAFYLRGEMYEYDPAIDQWAQKADYPDTAVIYPFAFTNNVKGYVSCGQVSSEIKKTFAYDPAGNSWAPKQDFPGMARQAGVSFVVNGIAYCGLGVSNNFSSFYNDLYTYNFSTESWSNAGNMPLSKRAWPAASVVGNSAYVGTGWSFTTGSVFYKDWWQFNAPTAVGQVAGTDKQLNCYPIPASTELNIDIPGYKAGADYKVIIYDMAGKKVVAEKLPPSKSINTSGLSNGIYQLEITAENASYHRLISVKH